MAESAGGAIEGFRQTEADAVSIASFHTAIDQTGVTVPVTRDIPITSSPGGTSTMPGNAAAPKRKPISMPHELGDVLSGCKPGLRKLRMFMWNRRRGTTLFFASGFTACGLIPLTMLMVKTARAENDSTVTKNLKDRWQYYMAWSIATTLFCNWLGALFAWVSHKEINRRKTTGWKSWMYFILGVNLGPIGGVLAFAYTGRAAYEVFAIVPFAILLQLTLWASVLEWRKADAEGVLQPWDVERANEGPVAEQGAAVPPA